MKKSPSTKKKQNDVVEPTPAEETTEETPVKASEAETVELKTNDILPTVEVNKNDLTNESAADETPVETVKFNNETAQIIKEPEMTEPVRTEEYKPRPVMGIPANDSSSSGDGIGALGKALIVGLIVLFAGVGLLVWKTRGGSNGFSSSEAGLTKLSKSDMELLLKDANPALLKRLAEDPETKKKQIDSIKQLLAVAEESRKSEIGQKPETKEELEDIRAQIIAMSYDKEKNKDKDQMPPFSLLTKEDVDKYYSNPANVEKVNAVIKSKIEQARKAGAIPEGQEPSEEELGQFKEQYAKINIYNKEAQDNWSNLSDEFKRGTELQVKLQQAQYLARQYAEEVLSKKVEVKDADIPAYLAAHPDADPNGDIKKYLDTHPPMTKEQKKAKAEDLLKRAKAGEDFAKLATENTDDPGSKNDGGLYKDVTKGKMMPEFEKAALALEPGKVADNLVETKYGYHIIKLEKKGTTKNKEGKEEETYDARHILISFTDDDPQSPVAAIKSKIEAEQQKKILDEIVARNPIEVAEDFEVKVPPMPEGQPNGLPPGMKLDPKQMEQLQKQMKEMQEKQQKEGANKPDTKKPAPPAPAKK